MSQILWVDWIILFVKGGAHTDTKTWDTVGLPQAVLPSVPAEASR